MDLGKICSLQRTISYKIYFVPYSVGFVLWFQFKNAICSDFTLLLICPLYASSIASLTLCFLFLICSFKLYCKLVSCPASQFFPLFFFLICLLVASLPAFSWPRLPCRLIYLSFALLLFLSFWDKSLFTFPALCA